MKRIFIILIALLTLSLVILFFWWAFIGQPQYIRKEVDDLLKNGQFSIGSVTEKNYHTIKGGTMLSSIGYHFYINDIKHKGAISHPVAKQISEKAGQYYYDNRLFGDNTIKEQRFLVVYEENDPKNSLLLLDRPIEKEGDFEQYVKEMEQIRKDTDSAN
ncbi:hypothetical protein LJC68_02080 [Bacteroidales bacterium OttesenSCG-928-B11]|nr:hypothetical protein [Bacteroidales bacterium OttesenSCG-928-C03]MDL2311649.1 hypothetical protein [Bacteroidales bacterium OttesenSCG-928-B11]